MQRISKFLSEKKVILPNAIILSFDNDVNLNFKDNKLSFPIKYCSAWIIDGQHRTFGFKDTKYKDWSMDVNNEFKLPVIVFKDMPGKIQSKIFIDINYNQKKIDPTLLCDLATVIKDLKNELTWPSLLAAELNKNSELKDFIKISELDDTRPIKLSSFVQYGLLETLLGLNKKTNVYSGPLMNYAKFNPDEEFDSEINKTAFNKQVELLKRYLSAVKKNTKPAAWKKDFSKKSKYALLKPTGLNALFLVLDKIMQKYPAVDFDLEKYLSPLKNINFGRKHVASKGGGWRGFRGLANEIIKKINIEKEDSLPEFGKKEKI